MSAENKFYVFVHLVGSKKIINEKDDLLFIHIVYAFLSDGDIITNIIIHL